MKGKDFVYGRIPVVEHLERGGRYERIILQKGIDRDYSDRVLSLAKGLEVPVQFVPHFKLDRVTRRNHQGVVAFTAWVEYHDLDITLQDCFESGEVPLIVLLDRVTDVRNMGAICRSAEIFGVTCVVLPERESAMLNADAVKASAGAITEIKLCRVRSLEAAIKTLRESGLKVLTADQRGAENIQDVDLTPPLAIIMGSEGKGVDPTLSRRADGSIMIPQIGATESLNVSVATGIVLYETQRQRKQS